MELSLYDRLGCSAGVHAIVEALHSRLINDPDLSVLLEGEDIEAMKRRQRVALCQLFGGPRMAGPQDSSPGDALLSDQWGLDDARFDHYLVCLGETLVGLNIQIHLAAEIETRVVALRNSVLELEKKEAA